jgi:cytochrome P450
VEFTPFTAGTLDDPYPIYRALRDHLPLYHNAALGLWMVSRYDDVRAVSRDWRAFANSQGVDTDHTGEPLGDNFLDSDPPGHDQLRAVLQRYFSPKAIRERFEKPIRMEVTRLFDNLIEDPDADFAHGFAWPLPIGVVAMVLGLPPGDVPCLRRLSETFIQREIGRVDPPPESRRAAAALRDYLQTAIEEKRRRPRDDVISLLVEAQRSNTHLSAEALLGNCALLYVAGTETTSSLFSNLAVLLASFPDERRWLAENPGAVDQAVEEVFRFDAPLAHLCRNTTREVEFLGESVPAGARIVLLYGSANRDERRFEDPDRFCFSREPKRHLALGDGIHHCLGASLARLEAKLTLDVMLDRGLEFELARPPTRLASHMLRAYSRVPLSFATA